MAVYVDGKIDFLGGPLDGYTDTMTSPLEPFLGVHIGPTGCFKELIATLLLRLRGGKHFATISLAVYELDTSELTGISYRYLSTQAVTLRRLQSGDGLNMIVRRLETLTT